MRGDDDAEDRTERLSVPRLRLGDGVGAGELDGSILGVRLRGLLRRGWVEGASKAKFKRFRRPLKLGGVTAVASSPTSSALIGRASVSVMMPSVQPSESHNDNTHL